LPTKHGTVLDKYIPANNAWVLLFLREPDAYVYPSDGAEKLLKDQTRPFQVQEFPEQ
jgi:hypothetical protein